MAKKVAWSKEAAEDLEAIAAYIARDSAYYASALVREMLDASDSLGMFFERGRIVPELGKENVRELFVREYRLIYSVERTRILVVGIIHGKRNIVKLWGK